MKYFCSIRERMKKHAWAAYFKLKARKSVFYTFTLIVLVKTRACRIFIAAVLGRTTFLYFQFYLLVEYNFFSLDAYSFFSTSDFSVKDCYSTFVNQFPPDLH